jgi:L-ascorbate metabolism protein UlaG (beta-lactamase superfamily)
MTTVSVEPFAGPLAKAQDAPPPADGVCLYWLGQAGFLLAHPRGRVVIDAYLSDALAAKYADTAYPHRRLHPAPIEPEELRDIDYLLATHAHSDHLDPWGVGPILRANPGCVLVCPRAEMAKALERGAPAGRLRGLAAFERLGGDGFSLEAVPSAHETLASNERGEHLHLGYVMRCGGLALYHSGDCVPYPELPGLLAGRRIDVALLPVNGRDEGRRNRGVPGNFSAAEAAALCRDAGIPHLIAHHFGLFEFNTVSPQAIRAALAAFPTVTCLVPSLHERIIVRN